MIRFVVPPGQTFSFLARLKRVSRRCTNINHSADWGAASLNAVQAIQFDSPERPERPKKKRWCSAHSAVLARTRECNRSIFEGTVTVSTDHTNESTSNSGYGIPEMSYFATPVFGGYPARDASGRESASGAGSLQIESPRPMAAMGSQRRGSIDKGTDSDGIEFRVVRPGAPVRRLRLTGNRYTFGSVDGCSIRLNDSSLRPMHAVLIRDAVRVLVRAYSVPIEVNGSLTTESELHIGDVLRLGTYDFELLSISGGLPLHTDAPHVSRPKSVFDGPSENPHQRPSQSSPRGGSRHELPSAEDVIWRERLRREIDQWRDRQVECDQREQRIDHRETHLRSRETELWSRAETLYRRESRVHDQESSILQLHDDFVQRQQDLIELREQTQSQSEAIRNRESDFRLQELEYREKLEEASRKLHQSQLQAESATQAVAKMREQFDSLNRQIDELSSQQNQISERESHQRDEHQQLRNQLESQRDSAIDGQAKSEAFRRQAEARIEEMQLQLESLKTEQGALSADQQAEVEANEMLVEQLRDQVTRLQETVSQASQEYAQLRNDYEESCRSVRQLESLVAQSSQRGDVDRESWTVEADELRAAVDQLSLDLARATGEVADLRAANESLSSRLDQVQRERDDYQSRPSHEAFDSLRDELESANDQLAEIKREYDETLSRLSIRESEHDRPIETPASNEGHQPWEAVPEVDDLRSFAAINAADVEHEPLQPELIESISVDDSDSVERDATDMSAAEPDEDVWPTYQIELPDSDVEPESAVSQSPWDNPYSDDEEITAESRSSWNATDEADDAIGAVDDDSEPVGGMLASMLIQDLENGTDTNHTNIEDVAESYEGTYVMRGENLADSPSNDDDQAFSGWDREYESESLPEEIPLESNVACEDESPETDADYAQTQAFSEADTSDITVNAASPAASEDEDDDSIEAYMNRLLNRVQGTPANGDTTRAESISLSASSVAIPESVSKTRRETESVVETIDLDAPLVPRSQAPERKSDLSAMRKLANDSARTAISRSSRIQTRNIQIAGLCNLGVAAVAVIAALLATFMLDGVLLYVAWAMALVIAGISVRDSMGNFAEAKRRMESQQEDTAENEHAAPGSVPDGDPVSR